MPVSGENIQRVYVLQHVLSNENDIFAQENELFYNNFTE